MVNFSIDKIIFRPKELSESHVNLEEVQKFTLTEMEKDDYFPDLIVHLEETYPFRSKEDLDPSKTLTTSFPDPEKI